MMDDSDIEAAATLLEMQAAATLLNIAVHGPPGVPDNLQELAWGARRRRSARPQHQSPQHQSEALVEWGARRARSARPQHQSVALVEWGARRARSARGRLQD
ncbi:hypothetical protein SLEP1_g47250 [Rubroshorea leprosula]|uniref:Uncharacterized protein n=1 Tax=Rubroshorea leprosula TaxID=152421 RepID=A0AAV5LSM1_9ROSI|nr:hypothetical protein SLEP1_g47250 [Rubroshorea leprosula]